MISLTRQFVVRSSGRVKAILGAAFPRVEEESPFWGASFPRMHFSSTGKNSDAGSGSNNVGGEPKAKDWAAISSTYEQYGKYLQTLLPRYIQKISVYKDELTLFVSPSNVIPLVAFLRDHNRCQFKQVIDVCGVDYPGREHRFEVVYHLLSLKHNNRIRIKTYASENSTVPSIVHLHPSANFFEREAYDMFGIIFEGHPDLRRILTDYGFEGHPFRKDFPLTGYYELRYDDDEKRIVQEPLEMTQEFRRFHFSSPWEQVPDSKKKVVKKDPSSTATNTTSNDQGKGADNKK